MSFAAVAWRHSRIRLLMLLATLSGTALAQNEFNLETLNSGEIMLNLSANEQTQVEQDTLHAQLNYITQGADRVALQDEVNRVMADALELLADSEIEYSTQGYNVYPIQPGRPTRSGNEITSWRAQQGLSLTSQDSAALLEAVADLQGVGMSMGGLNYSLSRQREQEVADTLMEAALTKLRSRAEAAAAALGKGSVEIVEVSMNGGNAGFFGGRVNAMAMSAEAMDVAAPVAEPGLTTVTFNVSARVILIP